MYLPLGLKDVGTLYPLRGKKPKLVHSSTKPVGALGAIFVTYTPVKVKSCPKKYFSLSRFKKKNNTHTKLCPL